jgi:membrane protease YdiL (CAAX protease family)
MDFTRPFPPPPPSLAILPPGQRSALQSARSRDLRRGWLALALLALPLVLVPGATATALWDRYPTDAEVAVTVGLFMYGVLLGIPVLLGVSLEAFRMARIRRHELATGVPFVPPRPRQAGRVALVVHTILLVGHDMQMAAGAVPRCARGDAPWWLIGYIPLLVFANFSVVMAWRDAVRRRRDSAGALA